MKPSIVVLAAGMGSRYGNLKQLDSFGPNGETIIDYSIYDAILAGFEKVIFIIRDSFAEEFKSVFIPKLGNKTDLRFVSQELHHIPEEFSLNPNREKPWGTAHAVSVARNVVSEPFAVINGDDYYGREAFHILYQYLTGNQNESQYCLIGYLLENTLSDHGTVNRGICYQDTLGFLQNILECTKIQRAFDGKIKYPSENEELIDLDDKAVVSMNMFGFYPSYFHYFDAHFRKFLESSGYKLKSEFYIPSFLDMLIKNGEAKVKVLKSDSEWFGVTYKEDKPYVMQKIQELLKQGLYPARLWE